MGGAASTTASLAAPMWSQAGGSGCLGPYPGHCARDHPPCPRQRVQRL